MRNGYVRFGQFLTFLAGVFMGNADFDGNLYVAFGFVAAAIVVDFVAISHIDKGVKEVADKTRQDVKR